MPRNITKTVYSYKELLELSKQTPPKITSHAVEKAREWLVEGATMFDWRDGVYDNWKPALALIGFEAADISFSGFWSQGDGASFTCPSVDLPKLIEFLATNVTPLGKDEYIDEDHAPRWIVREIGGKPKTNPRYRKLLRVADRIDEVKVERIDSHYAHWNTCRFRADLNDRGDYKPPELLIDGKALPIPGKESVWHSRTRRVRKLFEGFREDAETLRKDLCRAIYKDLEEEYEYRTADEQLIEDADANNWTFDENGRREG